MTADLRSLQPPVKAESTVHLVQGRWPLGATRSLCRPRWWREVILVAAFYLTYEFVQVAAPLRPIAAMRHSAAVAGLERSLHLDLEPAANRLVARTDWLAATMGYYYETLHVVVTVSVLVWLYLRRPGQYRVARRALTFASFGALPIFWAYPVAPPRLAEHGMTDILVTHNVLGAGHAAQTGGMVNLYAAMPSLHVGWAVWAAVTMAAAYPGRRWRALFALYPLATAAVVIGTANHYLLDCLAGALVVVSAVWLARALERSRSSARCQSRRTADADAAVAA